MQKNLHNLDNHNGVITHLEPDILECEVKWALGSITTNKASRGDGIPVELFQILKDDAVKVLPLVSLIFLKWSLVSPILLFSCISLHWSLRKGFLSLLVILWNSALKWVYLSFSPLPFVSLLFSAICKASSDNHFAFFHFFFLGMVLIPTSCTTSWSLPIVHQALCRSDLVP